GAETLSNKTLATGMQFSGYYDIAAIAAPASPSAGVFRVYADSSSGNLSCKNSSGSTCFPNAPGNYTFRDNLSNTSGTVDFNPTDDNVYWMYEDFATGGTSSGTIGSPGMTSAASGGTYSTLNVAANPLPGHVGVADLSSGTTQGNYISILTGTTMFSTPFNSSDLKGAGYSWRLSTVFRFPSSYGVTSMRFRTGLTDNASTLANTSGAFLRYDTNLGDSTFQAVLCSGSTCTLVDTGVAPAADTWYRAGVSWDGISAKFTMTLNAATKTFCASGCDATATNFPNSTSTYLTYTTTLGTDTASARHCYLDKMAFSMRGFGNRY